MVKKNSMKTVAERCEVCGNRVTADLNSPLLPIVVGTRTYNRLFCGYGCFFKRCKAFMAREITADWVRTIENVEYELGCLTSGVAKFTGTKADEKYTDFIFRVTQNKPHYYHYEPMRRWNTKKESKGKGKIKVTRYKNKKLASS